MTALSRFAVAAIAVALSVASCGQKGPLVLPEDETRAARAVATPVAVRLAQGVAPCGTVPHV